ncbi:transposase, partial [Streptomyces scopuliridis]|uniref:transposase n=1 Tax=Streptomyces scopuliridis TaxID=452529 RepID=UPI00341C0DEC
MGRIAGQFARVEPRRRAREFVLGLLSDLPRKNCWTIAEWAGEKTQHGMQHLLCRASWDADAVWDDVREYVVEHFHDEAAVLGPVSRITFGARWRGLRVSRCRGRCRRVSRSG